MAVFRRESSAFDQDDVGEGDENPQPAPSAPVVATTGQVVAKPDAAMIEFEKAIARLPRIDTSSAGASLALQILTGDADDAGGNIEGRSVRNLGLVNKPHVVRDIALAPSSYAAATEERAVPGPSVYAVVDAVDANGEVLTYSIGGWIPLAQLGAWWLGHKLPKSVMIIAVPSTKGNPAYRYVDA